MSATNKDKLKKIVSDGLCTRCGTCVGISSHTIKFTDKDGMYLPGIPDGLDETVAERSLNGCSASDVDFDKLNKNLFGPQATRHLFLGHFEQICIGYHTNPSIRKQSASGGVITGILIWLLETGQIDGAVVTLPDEKTPWRFVSKIVTDSSQILKAAQSKYVITSVNECLNEIELFDGKLAYVGLPCQVHSIRKLKLINDKSVGNIKYIIGPYCGNTLHFSSIISLLKSYGESDYKKIKSLSFREGEWPGNTVIELDNSNKISLPKFHANYLIPFHIMKRCLLCTDLSNEFADISVGDAWAPVYEERGKGFSIVIARSAAGENILNEMQKSGLINLNIINKEKAITMHSHGIDLKIRGAFIRLGFLRKIGKPTPDYNYTLSGFTFSRYLLEICIDLLFFLLSTKFSRLVVEKINPKFIGFVFQKMRTLWKKITKNIKQNDLK